MKPKAPGAPVKIRGILVANTWFGYVIGTASHTQEYYFSKTEVRGITYNVGDKLSEVEIEIPYHVAQAKGVLS